MFLSENYSWKLASQEKPSRLIVSSRPFHSVTLSVTQSCSPHKASFVLLEYQPIFIMFFLADHPHILAFSLIMLHTDAFNPSNKRKMTKADYIKNTKQPGIVTEVLDVRFPRLILCIFTTVSPPHMKCFFDNIVFAPFIFIEDPVELDGQLGMSPNAASSPSPAPLSAFPSSNGATFKMTQKIDPYYLIVNVSEANGCPQLY